MTTPAELIERLRAESIDFVDLKFIDLFGTWNHFQITSSQLTEDGFEEGIAFDGSSIRAWQGIEASDMHVVPDPDSARIDPFFERRTLSLICTIRDPVTGEAYNRDPRTVAIRAQAWLKASGIADTAYFGPEPEFFLFDSAHYETHAGAGYYFLDSEEAPWSTGEAEGNMGYKVRPKGGYFPVSPVDSLQNLRMEIVTVMQGLGLEIERFHHEVAPAQHEINFRYDSLVNTADNLCRYKYVVKNVAKNHGKLATFMPKPMFGDNGSGMHTHQSLWKDGQPLFAGDGYAGLSESALFYIGGLLKHARALAALTNSSTNSYRRLVPGFEAPVNLAYSNRNRSAAVRIPVVHAPQARRVEFRVPDCSCNPYLAFSAMLMAGLDGIRNRIHPGDPLDKDIYGLPPEQLARVPQMPANLREAIGTLQADHEFLLQGGVFSKELIDAWCNYKLSAEVSEVEARPVPHEFYLYFDL